MPATVQPRMLGHFCSSFLVALIKRPCQKLQDKAANNGFDASHSGSTASPSSTPLSGSRATLRSLHVHRICVSCVLRSVNERRTADLQQHKTSNSSPFQSLSLFLLHAPKWTSLTPPQLQKQHNSNNPSSTFSPQQWINLQLALGLHPTPQSSPRPKFSTRFNCPPTAHQLWVSAP